jgi:hypothetical protein
MRSVRRRFARITAIMMMLSGTLLGFPGNASAATYAPIGLVGQTSGIQWSPTTDRVYLTSWSESAVFVRDLDGTLIDTVAISGRAWDMDLVDGILYAALLDQPRIVKIDTTTLEVVDYLDVSSLDASTIAVAGGRVWFRWNGSMASVLDDDENDLDTYAWEDGFPYAPRFASAAGAPNLLLAWQEGDTSTMYRYDVSGAAPILEDTFEAGAVGIDNVVVAPDATRFYYSYGADPDVTPAVGEVRMSDLVKVRSYATGGTTWPTAITVSPDGGHIAFADGSYPTNIRVFAHAMTEPVRTISVGPTCSGASVGHGGLSFGPDDSTLSSLQQLESDEIVVYDNPTTAAKTSSIVASIEPGTAVSGDPYTVSGTLTIPGASPADRSIKVWAVRGVLSSLDRTLTTAADGSFSFTDTAANDSPCYTLRFQGTSTITGSSTIAVIYVERLATAVDIDVTPTKVAPTEAVTVTGTVSVEGNEDQTGRELILYRWKLSGGVQKTPFVAGPDGAFSIVDHPSQEATYEYAVLATETERWAQAQSNRPRVEVKRLTPAVSLTVSDGNIEWGERVKVTVTIPADASDHSVRIFEDPAGTATRKLVFDGSTGADGIVTIGREPDISVTYEAVFAGDERYVARSVERDVDVHAIVRAKMLKAFDTSGIYKLYHHDKRIYVGVRVIPDQTGKMVTINLEKNVNGSWREVSSEEFKLRDGSAVVVYIEAGALKAGTRWRVRGGYSDAPFYVEASSPYAYFKVVT